eukprot:scaffold10659_cov96-Isochrysis_galbana.AAC.6
MTLPPPRANDCEHFSRCATSLRSPGRYSATIPSAASTSPERGSSWGSKRRATSYNNTLGGPFFLLS